jgi:glutaredoxin-like protein NrdH
MLQLSLITICSQSLKNLLTSRNKKNWYPFRSSYSVAKRAILVLQSKTRNINRSPLMVTLYSKPNCIQCVATKKELDRVGVDYSVVDLTQDPAAFEKVIGWGYMQAPVVETANSHWSGFKPELIAALTL